MAQRLFGLETEYALTAVDRRGLPLGRRKILCQLIDLAQRKLPCLPRMNPNGVFFPSGSLYIDSGDHPELCTPECDNPWDLVRYVLAGETILSELAEQLENKVSVAEAQIFKCNVDYSGAHTTWGCHESYLVNMSPSMVSRQIIPFLASRLIYTGAGGFEARSPGLKFMLSPRATYLERPISSASTHGRGIFHTKDEPLCATGHHRLHVICGESLCSHLGMWLKAALTDLVVAMIEAQLKPAQDIQFRYCPVEAMSVFARDPYCQATVQLADGRNFTALMIQRHYLQIAEAHLHESFMPDWAPLACQHWRAILDRLQNAPQAVADSLDWAIKLALFQDHVRRSGRMEWRALAHWTHVLENIWRTPAMTPHRNKPLNIKFVLGPQSPVKIEVKRLTPYLREHGLRWDDLAAFLKLRAELLEIDTRFGQIGPQGIFNALDSKNVLSHAFSGVDNIAHAQRYPPAQGRAHLRGKCIQRLAQQHGRYLCDWNMIMDLYDNRILDLSDPFVTEEHWQDANLEHLDRHDYLNSLRLHSMLSRSPATARTRRQTGT